MNLSIIVNPTNLLKYLKTLHELYTFKKFSSV